jgi:hypothetical protein
MTPGGPAETWVLISSRKPAGLHNAVRPVRTPVQIATDLCRTTFELIAKILRLPRVTIVSLESQNMKRPFAIQHPQTVRAVQ